LGHNFLSSQSIYTPCCR